MVPVKKQLGSGSHCHQDLAQRQAAAPATGSRAVLHLPICTSRMTASHRQVGTSAIGSLCLQDCAWLWKQQEGMKCSPYLAGLSNLLGKLLTDQPQITYGPLVPRASASGTSQWRQTAPYRGNPGSCLAGAKGEAM